MTESSNLSATSFCRASIAAFERDIRSATVSLGVCSQIAQIRASTCLALISSGAALSAPNRKSRPLVLSAPTLGSFEGASGGFGLGVARGSPCAYARFGMEMTTTANRIAQEDRFAMGEV